MAKPAEPIARLPRRVMTIAGKIIFEDIPFSEPRVAPLRISRTSKLVNAKVPKDRCRRSRRLSLCVGEPLRPRLTATGE